MPYIVPENSEAPEMYKLLLDSLHPAGPWDLPLNPTLPAASASSSSLLVLQQPQGDSLGQLGVAFPSCLGSSAESAGWVASAARVGWGGGGGT